MKILIVTLPLGNNYGGLLQAYALQKFLKDMGHETWIANFTHDSFLKKGLRLLRNSVYSMFGLFYISQEMKHELSHNMIYFAKAYITPQTPQMNSNWKWKSYLKKNHFQMAIVGSDQVWRPKYVNHLYHYFLDFTIGIDMKRISYAASFGVDNWEYSQEQSDRCKKLLESFNAISVREDTGMVLCGKYFQQTAEHVLDPTFLLTKEDYEYLVEKENDTSINGDLFCYILDKSDLATKTANVISISMGLLPYTCMPAEVNYSRMNRDNIDSFKYPSVTHWLASIMNAKLVLTDSFHGCVFSIIFHKPFWVLVNDERGSARFKSLLKMFGLSHRIIYSNTIEDKDWKEIINWEEVDKRMNFWKETSINFIKNNIATFE